MEMDVLNGVWVPTLDSGLGLAVVSGGTDEVDRNVVGGDEAGEVEELVGSLRASLSTTLRA